MALAYQSSLAFITTCWVALSLFSQSVLQQLTMCAALDGRRVLLLYFSISAAMRDWHGEHK